MKEYAGESFDKERAFYGCDGVKLTGCAIDEPEDGDALAAERGKEDGEEKENTRGGSM